jgi:hypothetical protein
MEESLQYAYFNDFAFYFAVPAGHYVLNIVPNGGNADDF